MQYEDSGDQSEHDYKEAGLSCQPADSVVEGMSLPVNIQELPSYGSRHCTILLRNNLHLQNLFL
jgi:hypothetical protein